MADLVAKIRETKNIGIAKVETPKYTSKKQLIKMFKEKLATNKTWAVRGLMVIYSAQTEEEQFEGSVRENNGVGFVCMESKILTSFAKQFEKNKSLSEKQMTILFKKMPKYANQLLNISLFSGKIVKVGREYKFV